jgi:hypothetical protein
MNKWLVLILLVILNLKSFSQKDTTQISLNNQTAKLVVKDLIKGDGCKEELEQAYIKIAKLEERDIQKEEKIQTLEEKDSTNQFIISQKDGQLGEFKNMNESLVSEIKTTNNSLKWYKRGTFAGGGAAIILLILLL